LHRENLLAVLADYGIDAASLQAEEVDALNLAWHRLDPWPDSAERASRDSRPLASFAPPFEWQHRSDAGHGETRRHFRGTQFWAREVVQAYKPMPRSVFANCRCIRVLRPEQNVPGRRAQPTISRQRGNADTRRRLLRARREHGPGQTTDLKGRKAGLGGGRGVTSMNWRIRWGLIGGLGGLRVTLT